VNLSPKPAYGISLQYSNFGLSQQPGTRSLNDTVKIDQVTQSIIFMPRYMLQRDNAVHTFMYLFSNQMLNDRNKFQSQNLNMTTINHTLSYVVFLNNLNLGIDASAYLINTALSAGTNKSTGGSLGLNRGFFKNMLNTAVNATYNTNSFNGVNDGNTLQFRGNAQMNVTKHHRFRIDINYTKNKSITEQFNKSFSELLTTVMYSYTF